MAASEPATTVVVAAFDPSMMIPALTLIGALLIGAVVVAFVRRWQMSKQPLGPSASEQLAEFRSLYEKGVLSEEEFKRLRARLGGEIRQVNNLPPPPAAAGTGPTQTSPPPSAPEKPPDLPGPSGADVRPA
ncbi:MAG: SHOCT domain-containing protein [Gemmataceae bacterium]